MPYTNNKVADQPAHPLLRLYNTFCFHMRHFKTLVSLYSLAGRFESHLVGNPEDRFSRDGLINLIKADKTNKRSEKQQQKPRLGKSSAVYMYT